MTTKLTDGERAEFFDRFLEAALETRANYRITCINDSEKLKAIQAVISTAKGNLDIMIGKEHLWNANMWRWDVFNKMRDNPGMFVRAMLPRHEVYDGQAGMIEDEKGKVKRYHETPDLMPASKGYFVASDFGYWFELPINEREEGKATSIVNLNDVRRAQGLSFRFDDLFENLKEIIIASA